jgi:hypothetical protein
MGATLEQAEKLVRSLRSRFPYTFCIEEDWTEGIYVTVNAELGVEQDLRPYLSKGWRFSGWQISDQRAWIGKIDWMD